MTTRDQTGKLRDAEVTTSILEPNGKVLHQQKNQVEGEGNIPVPGIKMDRPAAQLVVKAQVEKAGAKVAQTLTVAEPAHAYGFAEEDLA